MVINEQGDIYMCVPMSAKAYQKGERRFYLLWTSRATLPICTETCGEVPLSGMSTGRRETRGVESVGG